MFFGNCSSKHLSNSDSESISSVTPSYRPSGKLSPTVAPTPEPATPNEDTSFMISFTNVTTEFVRGNDTTHTISIYFDVSKNKLRDMDFVFLDSACNVASEIDDN